MPFSEPFVVDPTNPPPEKDYEIYFKNLKEGITGKEALQEGIPAPVWQQFHCLSSFLWNILGCIMIKFWHDIVSLLPVWVSRKGKWEGSYNVNKGTKQLQNNAAIWFKKCAFKKINTFMLILFIYRSLAEDKEEKNIPFYYHGSTLHFSFLTLLSWQYWYSTMVLYILRFSP